MPVSKCLGKCACKQNTLSAAKYYCRYGILYLRVAFVCSRKVKDKSGAGTIDYKTQDNTVMDGVSYVSHYFRLLHVKILIQLRDLREMTSYRAIKNKAVYCFLAS